MKTYIVTIHHPEEHEYGVVTVATPTGRIESRNVVPIAARLMRDEGYPAHLIARMYPGVEHKIGDHRRLFRKQEPHHRLEVWAVYVDD